MDEFGEGIEGAGGPNDKMMMMMGSLDDGEGGFDLPESIPIAALLAAFGGILEVRIYFYETFGHCFSFS
jgi:hypothetical protein